MSIIPTKLTEEQFKAQVDPFLSKAKRGYVSSIPLFKIFNYILYWLHTGCQWNELPIDPDPDNPEKKEISWDAIYYHYRKWCRDGSFKDLWKGSILTIKSSLNLSELNLDGTHTIAKKGGESVAYQGRKRAKTSNILPINEANGYIIASTEIIAGNHHDSFDLKKHLQEAFKWLKSLKLNIKGAFFNADMAFDTKEARKTCFNYGLIPNIKENKRKRIKIKRGRKRFFNPEVYKKRFTAERSYAWIDKFRSLIIRFTRKKDYFYGAHCIAFAMINLRNVI